MKRLNTIGKFIGLAATPVFISQLSFGAEPIACPADSRGVTINEWRNTVIGKISEAKSADVKEALKTCFPTRVPKCLEAVSDYAEETLTGVEKVGTPTPLAISSEKELPPEFWQLDAAGKAVPGQIRIPENIFELAATKGWKVFDYKTRGTGGFDGSPNLVMIVLPNTPQPDKDIFLQISPPQDPAHPSNGHIPKPTPRSSLGLRTLTVITLDKTLTPPVGQVRLMTGDGRVYNWNNRLESGNCISCHTVPLRAISPRGYGFVNWEQPLSAEDQLMTNEINQMMRIPNMSWGFDQSGRALGARPDSHPYGWAPPNSSTRTEDFVKKCFADREDQYFSGFGNYRVDVKRNPEAQLGDWVKIKNNMNCVGCHDNRTRGYMHANYSFREIVFKVLIDRSMPPEANLDTDERLALLTCIQRENSQTSQAWRSFGSWMKRLSCGL